MDESARLHAMRQERLLRTASRAVERLEDTLLGGSSSLRLVVGLSAFLGGVFGGALGALIVLGVK